jgi:acyl dehydratase
VPVGAKLRIRATLQTVDDEGAGGVKVAWLVTFEIEGGDKPVCVALSLAKLYF